MSDQKVQQVQQGLLAGYGTEIRTGGLSAEELFSLGPMLDGMKVCAGCGDVFVLSGYCSVCKRLNDQLEERRRALQRVDCIDNGTVEYEAEFGGQLPFEALERQGVPSNLGVIAVIGGLIIVAAFCLTGMWFVGRGLVGFCLAHS